MKRNIHKGELFPRGGVKGDIRDSLERGGLVIAGRQTGKTTALLEYVASLGAENCIVVATNTHSIMVIEEAWRKICGSRKPPEIVASNRNGIGRGTDKKVFVDEWFYGSYRERFDGAVTSMPFPVTVVGKAKGNGTL